jgi:hypothetical protein
MKFITIECTVTERVKKTDGSQSIRIAQVFSKEYNPETGSTKTIQYRDCYIPFRWYTGTVYEWRYIGSDWKKGTKKEMNKDKAYAKFESRILDPGKEQQITFSETTPEVVQIYNTQTKEMDEYHQRFKFFIPEWMSKNLKTWRTSNVDQLDLFVNDNNPVTIIEEKSADSTRYSDERKKDLHGDDEMMYGSSLQLEIQEEFNGYSNVATNDFLMNLKRTPEIDDAIQNYY